MKGLCTARCIVSPAKAGPIIPPHHSRIDIHVTVTVPPFLAKTGRLSALVGIVYSRCRKGKAGF
jgi:hypothetical protein